MYLNSYVYIISYSTDNKTKQVNRQIKFTNCLKSFSFINLAKKLPRIIDAVKIKKKFFSKINVK